MKATRRIAITGATGFLGSHLAERLLRDGHRLRILARDKKKGESFVGRVEKIVVGDICQSTALADLMQGTDVAIHLVSNFRTAADPPANYWKTNVVGTSNALNAAKEAGVRRFIHCSTIGVHGDVQTTPATEESPYNPGDLYQETKVRAELACHEQIQRSGMEVVIIRPCSMYGPGDMRMLKMFRMLTKGTFFLVGSCRENFHAVYIDDIVEGFMQAMETPGIGGETFIIGGPSYLPLGQYIATAALALGTRPPLLRIPYWPLYGAAAICEAICVPLRIEPPLHRRRVRFYRNNRAFSIAKARCVLGYQPQVELDEGMRRTVAWYRKSGLLG